MNGPLVIDFAGTELSASDRKRLSHPLVGMVILFTRNFASVEQLENLCRQIHALRSSPLLICVDHEGGRVQRFRSGFTRLPTMASIGQHWETNPALAQRLATSVGLVLALELRACGVDFSFTPVLDLMWGRSQVIGDRAFHRDPRVVATLAAALNAGLEQGGLSHCGKHFPGHGWVSADSHVAIPVDERSLQEILAEDAAPYGNPALRVDSVMPAHVIYPQVDEQPAGFSRRWITDILRGQLGFQGAVFSDDLSMEGARVAGTVLQGAQAALAAGCDYILVCNDEAAADSVLEGLTWTPNADFAHRTQRLQPRLSPEQARAAMQTEAYQLALQDVATLLSA